MSARRTRPHIKTMPDATSPDLSPFAFDRARRRAWRRAPRRRARHGASASHGLHALRGPTRGDHRAIGLGQERFPAHARAARCVRCRPCHVARRAHRAFAHSGLPAARRLYRATARDARWHCRRQSALSVHAENLSRRAFRSRHGDAARAGCRTRRRIFSTSSRAISPAARRRSPRSCACCNSRPTCCCSTSRPHRSIRLRRARSKRSFPPGSTRTRSAHASGCRTIWNRRGASPRVI